MNLYNNLSELPTFKNAVITIGSYDGVHSGHQKIIERVIQLAKKLNGESIVITFHPHPRHVLNPNDQSMKLLTTIDEKVKLLSSYGIDNIVVVPFSKTFADQTPDEYIQNFLVEKFHPSCIVIGYDHRFGKGRKGDINYLKKFQQASNFEIVEIQKQEVEDIAVSSTKVRLALENGDVKTAEQLLNHPFTLSGTVARGQQIGQSIGFPTANLEVNNKFKLIPKEGIYAVNILHKKTQYEGMLYIGKRPTIAGLDNQTIEVNIFNFNKDIYGDKLELRFVEFIRNDQQFDGLEALKAGIQKDKESTLAVFDKIHKKQEKGVVIPYNQSSVAVVILNYNGKEHLEKFLPSVLKSSYANLQIIVADNGSTDDSIDFLKKQYPSAIEIIEMPNNLGFAQGYNEALQSVEADYFILLNSDVEVTKNWIAPVIKIMDEDKHIGACQPKIKSYLEKSNFEYAGGAGGWIDYLGIPFCRGRIFEVLEKDSGQYDQVDPIFWASGACFFVRANLFKGLGGFDGDYFAHMEEIDLCWRIQRAGYQIKVCPKSTVYHVGGGTLDYNNPRKTYLNFRNSLYTFIKNENRSKLFWLIPFRIIVIDALAGVNFLRQGKWQHLKAVVKAHWSFFGNFRSILKKRSQYTDLVNKVSISSSPNFNGVYNRSIIWQYYIRGKKYFKNLKH